MRGADRAGFGPEDRLRLVAKGPLVPEPERREEVNPGRFRPAVVDGDPAAQVGELDEPQGADDVESLLEQLISTAPIALRSPRAAVIAALPDIPDTADEPALEPDPNPPTDSPTDPPTNPLTNPRNP